MVTTLHAMMLAMQLTLSPSTVQQLQTLLAQMAALLAPPPAPASCSVTVAAGADLQAALNTAQPNCTLVLPAGATFTGNFVLPSKSGLVTITSSAPPAPGVRVSPTLGFARIVSPNANPAIATSPGAGGGYVLIGLEVAGDGGSDLILLGDGSAAQNSLTLVPGNLTLDRLYIHGSPANGRKRCVALNSGATTIENSYIADCKLAGQDAQAIAGWNGPGPYTITNNYIEGAGNNIIFGGTDPAIANLVPSNIAITGNTIAKPVAWRAQSWQVKNWLELKNALHVTATGNAFAYNWSSAQTGYGVVLTVRNQDGACPWCVVGFVTIANNTFAHAAEFLQILSTDDTHPSLQAHDFSIHDNVVTDLDPVVWGNPVTNAPGSGIVVLINSALSGMDFGHNSIGGSNINSALTMTGPGWSTGLNFHDNILPEGLYGIKADDGGMGRAAFDMYSPTAIFIDNAMVKTQTSANYYYGPQANYVLAPGASTSALATTDGKPIGAGQ